MGLLLFTWKPVWREWSVIRVWIPAERSPSERRVAATPETARRLADKGCAVAIESGAGQQAGYGDDSFAASGADVLPAGAAEGWERADVVLTVAPPRLEAEGGPGHVERLRSGSLLMGLLEPYQNRPLIERLSHQGVSALALELLPRISRAQTMDALSSQANIAGYKAVLLAAAELDRFFPMLMTAAGTVQPAKVVVLGAGVAGLQAVATARRLGAVVKVSDVRPAAKEQVESLGARFIDPPERDAPGEAGGYAREAGLAFLEAQRQQLAVHLAEADAVITTALVPGRPAPLLITEQMLAVMRPGSVVVDLAVGQGGNVAGSQADTTVEIGGVRVIGAGQLPASVPQHASALYARNVSALLEQLLVDDLLTISPEDPLLDPCLITHAGACRRPDLWPALVEVTA
ncbi:MAG: NAD(P)(+) transhydrogenase (Re/Si-specific) subunit alpha [Cyanobium sp.]|uniref:NAD(P) transhydrogenase subunit alpha n=1 Tax=Synechococcus sp. CS-1333 TaxID=2848638 RepID=UPI000DBBC0D6|nr:NAD(P) transhydrogenase subunit alpha [Synechococcus sp. CS-1333]MCT0210064.1 NAD(P) transhydrogenase subunit alpha [Synechococcus sp. CS-1333]PZV25155.1 MAG: NAD(P)(+) transhydrogenase (Re/Si-specific) subunit alpha [Cyanobium sp.]